MKSTLIKTLICYFFFTFCINCLKVKAGTITVSTVTALQSAINTSTAGTVILVASNTYTNASVTVLNSNITIKAATSGSVIFNGSSSFTISGSNNVLAGFQFKGGDIGAGNIIEINGNSNTITNCNFQSYGAHNYIHTNNGTALNIISY